MSLLAVLPFAFLFEAPLTAAAAAVGAVSVPVIIHLLNRKRFRIVEWAAMRFLLAAQRKNSRRMRIEQLLLLLIRCLIVLLLVAAMASVTGWAESIWRWANPSGGQGIRNVGARTHKIIVLDGSFSMGAKLGESNSFERAREMALQLVEQGGGGDGYSVVLMAAPSRRIVPEPSEDSKRVAAELRKLRMTHGNADLASTLNTVAGLLKASPGKFPAKEVYFFTDMQRSNWISPRPGDLAAAFDGFKGVKAKAIFVDVGRENVGNLAITNIELGDPVATPSMKTPIVATLVNYGGANEDVLVQLSIGKAKGSKEDPVFEMREIATTKAKPIKSQQTPVSFSYQFPGPGDYLIEVKTSKDDLSLDDVRTAVVRVRETVPVLLVNGKSAPELFDRGTEWLKVALNPIEEGQPIPPHFVFRPKVITPAQFADKEGDLTNYDAVFFCDVPTLDPVDVRRIETHVRRGGAAFFSLGEQVNFNFYNDHLFRAGQGLLPGKLDKIQRVPPGYTYQLVLPPDAERIDPLKMFLDSAARERLVAPSFGSFVMTEPARAVRGVQPRRILGLSPTRLVEVKGKRPSDPPGGPVVLSWQPPLPGGRDNGGERDPDTKKTDKSEKRAVSGRGHCVLINTTLNAEWTNWPTSPAFPPFIQELVYYAAAARLREQALLSGEPIELYVPSAATVEAKVSLPPDLLALEPEEPETLLRTVSTKNLGDGNVLLFGETDTTGIYKIRLGDAPREHLYAVNVPSASEDMRDSESNLERTSGEELEKFYPDWDTQVVSDLSKVRHADPGSGTGTTIVQMPQGDGIAHYLLMGVLFLVLAEVALAWQFGHYSGVANLPTDEKPQKPGVKMWALWSSPWALFLGLCCVGFIMIHDAITGDFLGFLPDTLRIGIEKLLDVPPPAAGEGTHWRLEYTSYLWDGKADPWLVSALGLLIAGAIGLVYWQEGASIRFAFRALLVALRMGVVLLLLTVFLPQLKLYFERQGWPDVVILVDDSYSMSAFDAYRDERVKTAANALAKRVELSDAEKADLAKALAARNDITQANRLALARALLSSDGEQWLRDLLSRRKVRLHVYACSARARRLADATTEDETEQAVKAIKGISAEKTADSSQLGASIRQVLNDFRGSSLAAIVMLTDGVTTEGEDIGKVSKYAAQMGVPLYFVGVGDSHEVRDLYLHDLQAEDSVYVHDRIVFELKVTGRGFRNLTVPVTLTEKGKDGELDKKTVTISPESRTAKVRLTHKPTETGEKTYIIRVPVQDGEIDKDNNVLEKTVLVRQTKKIRVFYAEGYRRFEYHYLKTLLERESARVKGNKSIELKVLLLGADPEWHKTDNVAIASFPSVFRNLDIHTDDEDLWSYDVVILGDIDVDKGADGKMKDHLKDIAEFVRERGGGLLVLGGERHSPHTYRNTALAEVLPIDLAAAGPVPRDDDDLLTESFRMRLTPIGRSHPVFRFTPDEKESDEIWERLKPFYWNATGYTPKRAAEVLAEHPSLKSEKGNHPLVLQQFAGAGRSMFIGVDELWRWNWREDQGYYNQFWYQVLRYLARSKLGKVELRLDRQTPYRRGEPIRLTVRFPDDEKPPAANTEVKVRMERRQPGKPGDIEKRTIQLTKMEGSRATYEAIVTQTPEGEYRFTLTDPKVSPQPRAECKVLAPPGEMDMLRMNQAEMEQAAVATQGKFYTLADFDQLATDLPAGNRVTVNASGPPVIVWSSALLFLLVLGLLTAEWLLRKTKNLL